MENLTQPTLLLKPFAENGQRNSIPENATGTNQASLDEGFPPLTAQNPRDGGIPPVRLDFNGLGHLTTTYDYFYQAGGTFTFNQTICDAIGGYPLGARLWHTDENGISMILESKVANNTNNFLTDSSVIGDADSGKPWEVMNFRGIYNRYPLLSYQWADHELNDMSWLRADTFSWQDGELYTTAYEHLVDDFDGTTSATETIGSYTITYYLAEDGHKIVLPDMEATVQNIYNESGAAWYYILDTSNQRFKLPRENPAREVLGQSAPVIGNGNQIYLSQTAGTKQETPIYIAGASGKENLVVDDITNVNRYAALTSDPTKSGMIVDLSETTGVYKGKQYLYFYVGNFTQPAIEQTAGVTTEVLNEKLDSTTTHIVETYQNGTSWYRVYSDGWCEQGGYISSGSVSVVNGVLVTFLKSFVDSNYTITMLSGHTDTSSNAVSVPYGNSYYGCYQPSSKTSATIRLCGNGTWQACGYIA